SSGKVSYPGRKQIFRRYQDGQIVGDRLGLVSEQLQSGEVPMMQLLFKEGQRVHPPEMLEAIAERTRHSVESLPPEIRRINQPSSASVEISTPLQTLTTETLENYKM
ncbi:nicotinate phosphoribosyltransferase, partial [Phormidium pseudopriestleyi FRX01]|nr:nicotinate phosphoribosyltransferase [Phormidium pseudopriestleyi FRX01]